MTHTTRTVEQIEADIERGRAEMARLHAEQEERYLSGLRPGDRVKIESHASLLAAVSDAAHDLEYIASSPFGMSEGIKDVAKNRVRELRAAIALAGGGA